MDDLTLLVTGLTGLDAATLGTYLLTLVSVSTVAGLVAPWLEARLPAWIVPRFSLGLRKAREAKLLEERK